MFAKTRINRHLKTHLDEKAKSGKSGVSYFVKVEVQKWAPNEHFLSRRVIADSRGVIDPERNGVLQKNTKQSQ
ncbi:hypothetical protein AGMMS49525_03620 [Bacteroidia bacterium]|nr:hypothetical protein AGMMS49525_03620 [Bacteroidia bacterium]